MTQDRRPSASDVFDRFQPAMAVSVMAVTFLLMPQAFAIALVAAVWLVATRVFRAQRFMGLTLTQALAWAAALVVAFLVLAIALVALSAVVA